MSRADFHTICADGKEYVLQGVSQFIQSPCTLCAFYKEIHCIEAVGSLACDVIEHTVWVEVESEK
jgi:hypothetical protein